MYDKIVNPETGRKVSIYGKIGQSVIRNYLSQIGGNPKIEGTGMADRELDGNLSIAQLGHEAFHQVYGMRYPRTSGLMVNGTIDTHCAKDESGIDDDSNFIYPEGKEGVATFTIRGKPDYKIYNEFWYNKKTSKANNHFEWQNSIDLNGQILQVWLFMCGIHSIIVICHKPKDLNIEGDWEEYWKDLNFFALEYESTGSQEGKIEAHNLTKWLTTDDAVRTFNDARVNASRSGIEPMEEVLKHIPGYGLTVDDYRHEETNLRGPSGIGCIDGLRTKKLTAGYDLQYMLGLTSRIWKLVDTYKIYEASELATVNRLYEACKTFLRNHRNYALGIDPRGQDGYAHCQTFANCVWQILTGRQSRAQGIRA